MKISFSNHGLVQLRERNLSQIQVIKTVNYPDKVVRQSLRRFRAMRKFDKNGKQYLLIVIYDKFNSNLEIVTTFITSKLGKYL